MNLGYIIYLKIMRDPKLTPLLNDFWQLIIATAEMKFSLK